MGQYTRAGYERLLVHLADAERRLAEAHLSLGEAADDGNNTWHDNFAFDQAKRDIDTASAELNKARMLVDSAEIIDKQSNDAVCIGCIVTIGYPNGETRQFHIEGEYAVRSDGDEVQVLSTNAPLGNALMGKRVGEEASFVTPKERCIITVTVLEVV